VLAGPRLRPDSSFNGNKTMIDKKAEGKQLARSRVSLASRLLGSAVRSALPVTPTEEPWREKNSKKKHRGKKHK
jgi:hypothetical protein